ncbi:MAG: sugar ABC transporter permease [Candidatus Kaistia colombiensis]|nr:MAG: sugar ABC transporter permease [Kaistia sp.]
MTDVLRASAVRTATRRPGSLWRRHREWITPVLLLAPGLILFLLIIVIPTLQSFRLSLYDWDGIGPMSWVGLGNYSELFADPQFLTSLKNNIIWLILFLLAPVGGLVLALLVNQKVKGIRLAKSLFFMPLVLAPVTVGVVYSWFYDPTFGMMALIFNAFGATPPAILSDPDLVTFGIVAAALWPQVAFCMVLFLAGLNNLDEDVLGAGRVDGARGFPMFWHVVLPQLRAASFIALTVTVIGALRSFDLIAIMTQGGPYGSSSVLAYQMYEQAIFSYRMGYAAAIATVLFGVMAVFIIWYLSRVVSAEARRDR